MIDKLSPLLLISVFLVGAYFVSAQTIEKKQHGDSISTCIEQDSINTDLGKIASHIESAVCFQTKGRFEEALIEIDNALKIDGGLYQLYYQKGIILLELDLINGAIEVFSSALNYQKTPELFEVRGDAHKRKKDYENALSDYESALAFYRHTKEIQDGSYFSPIKVDLFEKILKLHLSVGRKEEAKKTYLTAIRSNPGSNKLKQYKFLKNDGETIKDTHKIDTLKRQ